MPARMITPSPLYAILTHGAGTAHGGGTNQIEIIDLASPPEDVHVW